MYGRYEPKIPSCDFSSYLKLAYLCSKGVVIFVIYTVFGQITDHFSIYQKHKVVLYFRPRLFFASPQQQRCTNSNVTWYWSIITAKFTGKTCSDSNLLVKIV